MAAPVNYFEIIGKDAKKLQNFYQNVFDWTILPIEEMGGYGLVNPKENGGADGAVGAAMMPEEPTGNRIYCMVPDLDATLEKVVAAGGKVVIPPTEIPDMVTFALYADPEGNVNGIYKG
ncbi:VOC family protein [bacterium]|nr:VOC family protein [bacterium]